MPRFREKTSIDTFENEYLKGLNLHKKLIPFLYGLAKKENISHLQMASALITAAYIILRQKELEWVKSHKCCICLRHMVFLDNYK